MSLFLQLLLRLHCLMRCSYVILDTPGQIEIFTWSASGAIITDAVASSLPTVVAYIIDTPRTTAPATFMSNMLYACRLATFGRSSRRLFTHISV